MTKMAFWPLILNQSLSLVLSLLRGQSKTEQEKERPGVVAGLVADAAAQAGDDDLAHQLVYVWGAASAWTLTPLCLRLLSST